MEDVEAATEHDPPISRFDLAIVERRVKRVCQGDAAGG